MQVYIHELRGTFIHRYCTHTCKGDSILATAAAGSTLESAILSECRQLCNISSDISSSFQAVQQTESLLKWTDP
jgi:hypothetical protein